MAKKAAKSVWEKNFAGDEEVVSAIREIILPKLKGIRDDRSQLEDDWTRFYNMWSVVHDWAHGYQGRAKLYVPEVRKNIEAQARVFVDNAFPNDDFLDCHPGFGGTKRGAQMQKSVRMWQIQQAQLKLKYHVFARQQCMYGTSPAYVCWSEKMEHAFRSARDPKTGKVKPSRALTEIYRGPEFMVRDLFHWYALNPNRNNLDEDGCADYQIVDRFEIMRRAKAGMVLRAEDILKGNSSAYSMEELSRDIIRAESTGLQIQANQAYAGSISLDRDREEQGTYLCATVYARIQCAKACLEDEDPELGIPMKIEIYNDEHIGFVGRNPFFHQRPPYVVAKYIQPNPNEYYGQGIPQATQYMQYEMNSKAEQAMDSVTYALNPIAFIDPAMAAQGGELEIEPGAKWFVNPQGVRFSSMPDVSATGYNAIGLLKQQIQDYSDRTPSLPPELSGKARTATQASIVSAVASIDVKAFQEQNEIEVLQPLMQMWESLTDQNIQEEQVIMILGQDSKDWKRILVNKNQMLGHYEYFWRVSRNLQNKQIQARQMIDAMKMVGSLPPEASQKLNFNFAEAFRILWSDLWNMPNANRVLSMQDGPVQQDPETIYKMIQLGMDVEVLPGDDDRQIIAFLDQKLSEEKDKGTKEELMRQILLHDKQFKLKQQAMAQLQQQKMQQIQLAQQQAQSGGKGGAMQGSGNRTTLSPNSNPGDMGSGIRA